MGGQNIGFAIPIGLASQVMGQIIESGSVRRAWLGAHLSDLPLSVLADGSAARMGIQVGEVSPSSPAWFAGLQEGDILFSLGGQPIDDARAFLLTIAQYEPGTRIELGVRRESQEFETYATLIQQPPLR
jgi:S1-C subfamily serine protease